MEPSRRNNYIVAINNSFKAHATKAEINTLGHTMGQMLRIGDLLPASSLLDGVPNMVKSAAYGCTICDPDRVAHSKSLRKYYQHVLNELKRLCE